MIFGRNRKRAAAPEAGDDPEVTADAATDDDATDLRDSDAAQDVTAGAVPSAQDGPGEDADDVEPDAVPGLDVETLDATEWRTDGPFDVRELHDEDAEPDDDHPRIDLGSLVLTGLPGSELRLQVAEETQEIVSAMLVFETAVPGADGASTLTASSALELSAYAAPRSGGLWAELRAEIAEAATAMNGSASLAEGPFGVELRRLIPVTTPEGEQGYQPSRMWMAEGPRWMLRGIVYGQAAIEEDLGSAPVSAVVDAFRAVVVRRGDEAMAPGDLLPLTMPGDLAPVG